MPTFQQRSIMDASASELFAWHLRPGAFERLVPPFDSTRVAARQGRLEDNTMTVDLSVPLAGPVRGLWKVRHDSFEAGRQFRDVMTKGPFTRWEHTHLVEPIDGEAGRARLIDSIDYQLPLGRLGALGSGQVRSRLATTFAYRHAVTSADLRAHAAAAAGAGGDGARTLRIAVTGATGMIGGALWAYLSTAGHEVVPVVRDATAPAPWQLYDLPETAKPIVWGSADEMAQRLEGIDAVVHLAGEPVVGRWTSDKRARILGSRADGTRLLAEAIARCEAGPSVFVSASAIGAYGDRGEEDLAEDAGYGSGFLSDVARAWESAADPAREAGVRVVHPRIGIVMTPAGGALPQLMRPMKFGAGGPLGSGKQIWSWVTLDDVLAALEWCIVRDDLHGPVNVVAPEAMVMRDVARTLAHVMRRPSVAPAPAPVLRAVLGRDLADEMLLASQRVMPEALASDGFAWRDEELEPALRRMLGRI